MWLHGNGAVPAISSTATVWTQLASDCVAGRDRTGVDDGHAVHLVKQRNMPVAEDGDGRCRSCARLLAICWQLGQECVSLAGGEFFLPVLVVAVPEENPNAGDGDDRLVGQGLA